MRHSIAKHIHQLNDLRTEGTYDDPLDKLYEANKEDIDFLNQEFLEAFERGIGPQTSFEISQSTAEDLEAVQLVWESYRTLEDSETKMKLVRFVLADLFHYYEQLGFACAVEPASGHDIDFKLTFELYP